MTAGAGMATRGSGTAATLKNLVGAGDRVALVAVPVLSAGLVVEMVWPSALDAGGPPRWLALLSALLLVPGVVLWLWSAILIAVRVPRGELITTGPFALVKHPLYTSVALLVLPWVGFVLDSWVGALTGAALYGGTRLFAPLEERALATTFGRAWDEYTRRVVIPWL